MNDKHPHCPDCDSKDISITPVPGLWVQYWCNDCDHFWWERSDVAPETSPG
ncbi:MAG TPA: hypothetical protein VNP73_12135 [Actinomycetota bacterium]|nr:hypothetical protein [Actinomycetota bacterium]